ncbi:MAG TPA: hypothetical protein VJ201_04995 [Candidatus Babeliales bacterium]|nr:hypothetical protein [Candidatus Babeliales bacterium]
MIADLSEIAKKIGIMKWYAAVRGIIKNVQVQVNVAMPTISVARDGGLG